MRDIMEIIAVLQPIFDSPIHLAGGNEVRGRLAVLNKSGISSSSIASLTQKLQEAGCRLVSWTAVAVDWLEIDLYFNFVQENGVNEENWEDAGVYTWGYGDVNVVIYGAHRWGEYGRSYHRYILQSAGEVIFKGDDFSPSPFRGDIGDTQVAELLGSLTLKPGDTDSEYFEDYTPRQLEWCQSAEAEDLSLMASDYENYGTWYYDDSAG